MITARQLGCVVGWLMLGVVLRADDNSDRAGDVFSGPAAEYEHVPPVASADNAHDDAAGVVRWVWVEERMNVARRQAPVRVPVFLAVGECRNVDELQLVRWPSGEAVAMQADDIRRGSDGGIARLHLWFTTDLSAGEHARFALVRRGAKPLPSAKTIDVRMVDGRLQIHEQGSTVLFDVAGNGHRPLLAAQVIDGPNLEFPDGAGATVTWKGGSASAAAVVPNKSPVIWGTGPVFAKVVVQFSDETGAMVTQIFRVFGDGSLNIIQTIKPSDQTTGLTLVDQDFGDGTVESPDQLTVRPQTAEIVDALVGVHPGYVVDAILSPGKSNGWLVVPGSLGGVAGRVKIEPNGHFQIQGPESLTPGVGDSRPGTVKAFWAEVTLVPARREGSGLERATLIAAGQPLVAVVERPGVSLAMAVSRLRDNVQEMKPVGWINESLIRFLNGKQNPFPRRNWPAEGDPESWVASAEQAKAKVTGNSSRPVQDAEKGRAAGPLDPYHFTYGTTALVYWLLHDDLPVPVLKSLRAQMEAVRRELGRTNEEGWPYLDVFFRTQNMQMGPPLLTLADAGADPELRRYYRDQLLAPTVGAVMLRGLRPYAGSSQTKPSESDTLYQAVVDIMLRATELSMDESLGLQPVAFGRYLDAIDVNADLYHPVFQRSIGEGGLFARANFFRTQSHLHRWLAWGPAPFIALLQVPPEKGSPFPGATEAWQFANMLSGQWKNWPDQSWLFLASVLPDKAATYKPAMRPAAIMPVHFQHLSDGNHVAWEPQPDAVAYRVYRLRTGFPPLWVGSPYHGGKRMDASTERIDTEGKPDDAYLVHVMDKEGRESAW
jgi:hypothetical protein